MKFRPLTKLIPLQKMSRSGFLRRSTDLKSGKTKSSPKSSSGKALKRMCPTPVGDERSQKSEDRGQRSEIRSQTSENKCQISEIIEGRKMKKMKQAFGKV